LAEKISGYEPDKFKSIFSKISNTAVNISYTDIYLKSPLSCRLLVDVVSWFVEKASLQVNILDLYLAEVKMGRDSDFYDTRQRDNYITKYAEDSKLPINLTKPGKLPHYRELKIENEKYEFIIRPDGGFENGWIVDYVDKYSGWENNNESNIRLHNISVDGVLFTIAYKQKL